MWAYLKYLADTYGFGLSGPCPGRVMVMMIYLCLFFTVSSSEQGSGSGQANCNGIIVDWGHLEAVYESCVSATDSSTIDDLLRLHTSISSLIYKHIRNSDRSQLLQVCNSTF